MSPPSLQQRRRSALLDQVSYNLLHDREHSNITVHAGEVISGRLKAIHITEAALTEARTITLWTEQQPHSSYY